MYIIIIGAGDVGYNLAKQLSREDHDIIVIEKDRDKHMRVAESLDVQAICGNGVSYSVLEQANIRDADMLVAVTTSDEVNLLSVLIAKEYGVGKTVARVKNSEFLREDAPLNPEKFHIDLLIHPESVAADAAIRLLEHTSVSHVIEFEDGSINLIGIELDASCPLIHKTLIEIGRELRELVFRVIAIQRHDLTRIPTGSDELLPGDRIFIAAKKESLSRVLQAFGKEEMKKIQYIMIMGGGQTGYVLARGLECDRDVKLIEVDQKKATFLGENLKKTLVIHGDGRDLNLLALEGITDMEAFIAVTGDDETNIISCLMAKHLKVPRIIAMINKMNYTPILHTIGIDAYISKQMLTVDAILKFIRKGEIVSVASLPGITAEALEMIPKEGSKITRKPLSKLKLPNNAILGVVMRENNVFIPVGDTQIRAGDRVVLFALPSAIRELENFFN